MSEVLHERLEGGILLLRINRPEAKNALNQEVRRLLAGQQPLSLVNREALDGK